MSCGCDWRACPDCYPEDQGVTMRFIVTAFPRKPLHQQVDAENGDAAIDAAIAQPDNWTIPPVPDSDDCAQWDFYAMPVDEPTQEMLDAAETLREAGVTGEIYERLQGAADARRKAATA